jgi:2-keto-4-pentenoate hydratase/2-oxohepta-3-ene-1,7-dioic acid hydratase in catechol pathway
MKPGDKVEIEITGLGVLANTIAADEKPSYRPL